MSKSDKIVGGRPSSRQTQADLTVTNQALVDKVLTDPSVFPDTFTAWLPRWIMQNVNFKVSAAQLPSLESAKVVGASGQPAFQNSWVYFGSGVSPQFYKNAWNMVNLSGIVKSGTVSATATGDIFTLPAGYRPLAKIFFAVASNGAFGLCTVDTTGEVRAEVGNNTYFSLEGVAFRAYS